MTEVEVKEWGNSFGIIIPKEKVNEFNLAKGDKVEIEIVKKVIIDAFGIAKGTKPFKEEKDNHLF